MAPDAVDDTYCGCTKEIEKKVDEYFKTEFVDFKSTWEDAESHANSITKARGDKALTINQIKAIYAYTSDDIYKEFNEAVRTGRSIYGSLFKFKSLHFWLTTAIQTLNSDNHCHTTYRGTSRVFTGKVDDTIRFGMFASSSYRTDRAMEFGCETGFKIKTCHGASLKHYSKYVKEEEVLIPPYETFKITNVYNGPGPEVKGLEACKKVFVLESSGSVQEEIT
ncbi:Ecto-ADP-ribosyltransferase 5 [Merluccius polli]|uniref:NAD(P)(+)--arginine ADP-ribosyltransferase n=1 Tax=Merluccius polli TaxID=89951 RepID=A0AA47N3P1_MERPO|nr:Ecto-ADP-ribosyltransferase 5 [Merluccius polli]